MIRSLCDHVRYPQGHTFPAHVAGPVNLPRRVTGGLEVLDEPEVGPGGPPPGGMGGSPLNANHLEDR